MPNFKPGDRARIKGNPGKAFVGMECSVLEVLANEHYALEDGSYGGFAPLIYAVNVDGVGNRWPDDHNAEIMCLPNELEPIIDADNGAAMAFVRDVTRPNPAILTTKEPA